MTCSAAPCTGRPAWDSFAREIGRFHLVGGRGSAGAHDDAGTLVRDLCVGEAGIGDRFAHGDVVIGGAVAHEAPDLAVDRSEEHTSELQSLMRISYAVFCLKKKKPLHKRHTLRQNTQHTTKDHI